MNRRLGAAWAIAVACSLAAGVAAAGNYPGSNGSFSAGVQQTPWGHDEMQIEYTPDPAKVVNCGAIYLIQTVKAKDQNGAVIQPRDLKPSGDIPGPFENLQDDLTAGGTAVDHVPTEKDPEYNGEDEGKDETSKGSTSGTTATPTSMTDEPYIPDAWFPAGVTAVTLEFETCAVCKDTGAILDCITWSYSRTKDSPGHGSIAEPAGPGAAPPSEEFKQAKAKFEKNHDDGKKCPEEKAEENPGEENAAAGFHQVLPPFPHPLQFSQVLVDVVNSSAQPMNAIPWTAVDLGGARLLASGMVPFLEPFSFATVAFAVPPVPSPAQGDLVVFTIDPANTIPEYDETDNVDAIPIGYYGAVGVEGRSPDDPRDRVLASPNPFFVRTRVSFALPRPADVRVEVFDAAGGRVRVLHAGLLAAGIHACEWDGRNAAGRRGPAGVYWVRVESPGQRLERKLLLLR
jgi:hypothetical protein